MFAVAGAVGAYWAGMTMQDIKAFFEVVAIIGAGSYFLHRALAGFFLINASLHLECTRSPQDDCTDYLVCKIHLKKGDRGTLQIHDAQIRIGNSEPFQIGQLRRLAWVYESIATSRGHSKRAKIQWEESKEAPLLHLAPGEEAVFAWQATVSRSELCFVEVVLLGKLPSYPRMAQWRATSVSTPIPHAAASSRQASLAPSVNASVLGGPQTDHAPVRDK